MLCVFTYDYTFIIANGYKSEPAKERDTGWSLRRSQMWNFCTESGKQSGGKGIDCLSLWSHGWLGAPTFCCCPATWKNIVPHMASLGKDQNSKYNFYGMCIAFKLP